MHGDCLFTCCWLLFYSGWVHCNCKRKTRLQCWAGKLTRHAAQRLMWCLYDHIVLGALQALGMLFWHKHSIEKSLADLPNFTPFPDEWTVEDKVLFEQAFSFHGKSFHRIQQMVSDHHHCWCFSGDRSCEGSVYIKSDMSSQNQKKIIGKHESECSGFLKETIVNLMCSFPFSLLGSCHKTVEFTSFLYSGFMCKHNTWN